MTKLELQRLAMYLLPSNQFVVKFIPVVLTFPRIRGTKRIFAGEEET
jgi:hypothetical protein